MLLQPQKFSVVAVWSKTEAFLDFWNQVSAAPHKPHSPIPLKIKQRRQHLKCYDYVMGSWRQVRPVGSEIHGLDVKCLSRPSRRHLHFVESECFEYLIDRMSAKNQFYQVFVSDV